MKTRQPKQNLQSSGSDHILAESSPKELCFFKKVGKKMKTYNVGITHEVKAESPEDAQRQFAESILTMIANNDIEECIDVGEIEPNRFNCPSACPKCGAEDAVDWQTSEHDGETLRQSGSCGQCDCDFTEISDIKYLYTEIDF